MSEARGPSNRATTTQRVAGPIVEARGVVKTYRSGETQVQALRGTELVVARGEMVAIVGPSGSGKTTLLNCLSGLDDVDEGEVLIAGRDIHRMSDRERTAFRGSAMGFIFQAFNLVPVFTAVENVELPLLLGDARPDDARRRAEHVLAQVGLIGSSTDRQSCRVVSSSAWRSPGRWLPNRSSSGPTSPPATSTA